MLALPENGMPKSPTNYDSSIICDWIEGSVLFDETDDKITVMDIVDVIIDADMDDIYTEQEFAINIVLNAIEELKRRLSWINPEMPFLVCDTRSIVNTYVKRNNTWQDTPAHSFCILLSLAQSYVGWQKTINNWDYNTQGNIFELLTLESLKRQFTNWRVKHTGWSSTQTKKIHEIVKQIADCLGETVADDIDQWIDSTDKDKGLDLLLYHPFPDNRTGFPVYLFQCASGKNWHDKIITPSINFWRQLIKFVIPPQRAFAIPYALSNDIFRKRCAEIEGLFLDRYRLLAAAKFGKQWESQSLKDQIIKWATPKIKQLPRN